MLNIIVKNDDGRRIMRLIYYFRDFYRNLKPEK